MRGGGCGRGSSLLPVRGSDCWAAAGSGGHGGGGHGGRRDQRRRGEGCTCRGGRAGAAGAVCAGFGDRVPAELRLVLAGYVGIAVACSLPPWPAPRLLSLSFSATHVNPDDDTIGQLFELALMVCIFGLGLGLALEALEALKAGNRFSRLLRRPAIHTRPR